MSHTGRQSRMVEMSISDGDSRTVTALGYSRRDPVCTNAGNLDGTDLREYDTELRS